MRLSPPHARSRRCQHARARAVERVLFGGWGRTHTRWAGRPSSPVMGAAACPTHRLSSAFRAGSHPVRRAACLVPMRASSWTLAVSQGGFLRCAWSAAGFGRSASCTPTSCVRVGANPALGPRLHEVGPRSAAATRLGAGAPSRQARRQPDLPTVLRRRLRQQPPSPRPSTEGSESPSAVSGACQEPRQAPHTASVERRESASRPSPSGGRRPAWTRPHASNSATPAFSAMNSSRWRSWVSVRWQPSHGWPRPARRARPRVCSYKP